ncbi:hypothetical protein A8L51_20435 [Pantoea stewartii]|nr:hypothetical protein [Pantoea stewartii]
MRLIDEIVNFQLKNGKRFWIKIVREYVVSAIFEAIHERPLNGKKIWTFTQKIFNQVTGRMKAHGIQPANAINFSTYFLPYFQTVYCQVMLYRCSEIQSAFSYIINMYRINLTAFNESDVIILIP